MIKENYK